MKPLFVLLIVLAFAAGLFAGNPKLYYRVDPISANRLNLACTEGRPSTSMRLDEVLEVYCPTPKAK